MIFSRRSIQRMLNELRPVLGDEVVSEFARKLNKVGLQRLGDMWEVAVLHSLAQLGSIEHHVALESGRRPDVNFSNDSVSFIADVVTVSDEGLHEKNPIRAFADIIEEEKRKIGLGVGGVNLNVEEQSEETARGRKRKLRLPPRKRLRDYVRDEIIPELKRQKDANRWPLRMLIDSEVACFSLTIEDGPYSNFGHGAYELPTVITSNPLYHSLQAKADQLRGAEGVVGIFACDGHTASLNSHDRNWGGVTTDKIVREFMRQRSSIDFVMGFTVGKDDQFAVRPSRIDGRLWVREPLPALSAVLSEIAGEMPRPVNTAINASFRVQESGYGRGNGGWKGMTSRKITITVRDVMDVLAGRMSLSEMNERMGWRGTGETDGKGRFFNPFDRALAEGRLIEGAEVKVTGEEDRDNFIEFRFGEPDPAVSPFR